MIFEFTDTEGSLIRLYKPTYMKINLSLSDYADTLIAVFKGSTEFSTFKYLKVIFDEKIIFTGVVDSITNSVDDKGRSFTVNCRSMLACLLDNHIQPQNIQNITDEILYERFLKPLKIGINSISNKFCSGVINVGKGTNIYTILKEYSSKVFSATPYISSGGVVSLNGEINSNSFYFSNLNNPLTTNSYYCKSILLENNRKELISKVYVKNSTNETGYNFIVENENAVNNGVERVRYLDATPNSGNCIYDANRMIYESNSKGLVCTIKVPCLVYNPIGGTAVVNMDGRTFENLIIASASYTYSVNGIESEIKMYRK